MGIVQVRGVAPQMTHSASPCDTKHLQQSSACSADRCSPCLCWRMVGIGALPLRMRDEHLHEKAGLRIVLKPKVVRALCRGMVWDLFLRLGSRPREGLHRPARTCRASGRTTAPPCPDKSSAAESSAKAPEPLSTAKLTQKDADLWTPRSFIFFFGVQRSVPEFPL